jgi:uncharacterized protein
MKKTLVIGASENPERYSYKAIQMLKEYGHEVVALSKKAGKIDETLFLTTKDEIPSIDTVSLYVGPKNQSEYYDYVIKLAPNRVIFNPGTENPEFEQMLHENNISPIEACTLVMLRTGQYE